MQARNTNIVFTPDLLPETKNGIILGSRNPNHRTGTIKSVGPDVRWHSIKEGNRFLYNQRNCVDCDGIHIVSEESVLFQVASDVIFSYEELTPQNKIKVHLVKSNESITQ
jgi:hypothetical protein